MSGVDKERKKSRHFGVPVCLVLATVIYPMASVAQQQTGENALSGGLEEIIVTARQRKEELIDVPIAITAYTAAAIEKFAFRDMQQISARTPGLIIDENQGITGGSISLRGISTGTLGGDTDQPVSMNVDGVVVSRISTLQQGFFDVSTIEILKGPQALYFGKNSPAGIITFRTNDPTRQFEALARATYDFNSQGEIVDGIVSGPINDKWGARLALELRRQNGWWVNDVPDQSVSRALRYQDYFVRGTIKGEISDVLNIRLKINNGQHASSSGFSTQHFYSCPRPIPTHAGCTPDGSINLPDGPPGISQVFSIQNNGIPRERVRSLLASLEVNWDVTDDLTLTSVSGLNQSYLDLAVDNIWNNVPSFVSAALAGYKSSTEEVRLASHFKGPFQFTGGLFVQRVDLDTRSTFAFPLPLRPGLIIPFGLGSFTQVSTTAYSGFLQSSYEIVPKLTLSAGARYTHERQGANKQLQSGNDAAPIVPVWNDLELNARNVSPEYTLSYRPIAETNIYATYREGFKSGGFNDSPLPVRDPSVNPEHAKGYEIGFKSELFDRQLRLTAAAYRYQYTDLQVGVLVITQGIPSSEIVNAAAATVKGIEGELVWQPRAIPGLYIDFNTAFNEAVYDSYIGPCWGGQSPVLGCHLDLSAATGAFTSQNLAGHALVNAPKWGSALTTTYENTLPGTSGFGYIFSFGVYYSGSYNDIGNGNPYAMQDQAFRFDSSIRLNPPSKSWDVAVIGRNLSNVYRPTYTSETSGMGVATGTGTPGAVRGNLSGTYGEPRSVSIQVTVHF